MQNNTATFLVHGINVGDKGSDTVMQVAPHLCKYCTVFNHAYGRIGPIGACFKNKGIARELSMAVKQLGYENNYAVGHSNGCAIIVEALRQGAKFKGILLINPALKVGTVFPPGDYTITVIHTKHDKAVKAARFFDAIPFLEIIVPDIWGAMGARGYKGDDVRVENLCWDFLKGHSDIFTEANMNMVGPQLAMQLYPEAVSV